MRVVRDLLTRLSEPKGALVTPLASVNFFDQPAEGIFARRAILAMVSLSNRWVVAAGTDHSIRVFDFSEGNWRYKMVARLRGHSTAVSYLDAFADARVISADASGCVRVWDMAAQVCKTVFAVRMFPSLCTI